MTPDRWKKIEALFEGALATPLEERGAYLDQACRDDSGEMDLELRAEVAGLLAADSGAERYLSHVNDTLVEPLLDPLIGADVGPWTVLRQIGRGGMGTVYLAERLHATFQQQVALKVLHDVRPAVVRRFEAERQVLASLDHPGIARLLDGGSLPDGRPYFAMEYVRGVPLTTYADAKALSVPRRLALFSEICEVVRYAHSRLVVHRDIKPSNVFIADDGEHPRVKLLDFGVAKVLGAGPSVDLTTAGGVAPMTPEYASPEQISGGDVTTATDVYALGVLLYELLTGQKPFRIPSRVRHAVERAILDDEPTAPSAAAGQATAADPTRGTLGRTAEEIAAARGSAPERLRKELRGDLDQIVLKALRKDPAQRYSTAESLGRDIQRHVNGLPIEARAPSRSYRLSRFVRRNRRAVLLGAAIVATAIATAVLYTVGVTAERNRAEAQAARAEQVTADLISMFEAATPEQARGDTLTALEMLEAGAERIESRLGANPEADAPLALALARAYLSLGAYKRSETWAAHAVDLYDGVDGPSSAGAINALRAQAMAASYAGDDARGLVLFKDVVRRARASGEDSLLVQSLSSLVEPLRRAGDSAGTEQAISEALRVGRSSRKVRPLLLLTPIQELGLIRFQQGNQDEAVALYREALAIARDGHARPHPDVAYALLQLARILPDEEAEPLSAEAVRVAQAVPRGTEPIEGRMLGSYAKTLSRLGRHTEALDFGRRALGADVRDYGPDHPIAANSAMTLAVLAQAAGSFDEGLRAARRGVALYVDKRGDADLVRLGSESTLVDLLVRAGQATEGEALARSLIQRFNAAGRSADTQKVQAVLADALVRQRRLAEARDILAPIVSNPTPFAAKRVYEAAAALNAATGNQSEARRYRALAEK